MLRHRHRVLWSLLFAMLLGVLMPRLGATQSPERTINIGSFSFDPLSKGDPALEYASRAGTYEDLSSDQNGYHLLQFTRPVYDAELERVRQLGLEVLQYVPHNAFLVYATRSELDRTSRLDFVRYHGTYHPVHKVGTDLLGVFQGRASQTVANISRTYRADWNGAFDVAVFKRAGLDRVEAELRRQPGTEILKRIELPSNSFDVLRVKLSPDVIVAAAAIPDVFHIEPYLQPAAEDEKACLILAGNYAGNVLAAPGYDPLSQFGANGTNVTVAVVDDGVGIPGAGGVYVTAANAKDGPLHGAAIGAQGHGHLNASIIAGTTPYPASPNDSDGYKYANGVAPAANILNIPLLRTNYGGSEADACNDTVTTTAPNGVLGTVANNSWGAGTNGNVYDSFAAQFDGFVQDASSAPTIDPLLIIFSAGNAGPGPLSLTRPKVAKNLIAVAASENIRTPLRGSAANNLEDIASFSSRGPTSDGRVKPDLAAPGDAITGGRSGTDILFGDLDSIHRWSSGTSHAAPQVAGAAALFIQRWKNEHSGVHPSPALVKAALINGTVEMTGVNAGTAMPNGAEGWGRLNLQKLFATVPVHYVDQSETLADVDQTFTWTGEVVDNTERVRITLVWTDPPAVASPALVNNLDLEVTIGGNTYRGNALSNGFSVAGGAASLVDNVENVILQAGTTGSISIVVKATALNGNGILGNADATDQHFALVAYNVTQAADFSMRVSPDRQQICAPADAVYDIDVSQVLGFANPVMLSATGQPPGSSVTFNPNPVTSSPPGSATMTVAGSGNGPAGTYLIDVQGSAASSPGHHDYTVLERFTSEPTGPTPLTPADDTIALAPATLTWSATEQATSYDVEVATDSAFQNIVSNGSGITTESFTTGPLDESTQYFWRVRANNPCGSAFSPTFRFTTAQPFCTAPNVAIPDNSAAGVTNTLTVSTHKLIGDLNVLIKTQHTWVGDLIYTLRHVPTGTTVTLIDRIGIPGSLDGCDTDDIDVTLDGAATDPVESQCNQATPAVRGTLRPNNPLLPFLGEDVFGDWELNVSDRVLQDSGTLNSWCLVLDTNFDPGAPTPSPTATRTQTGTPSSTSTPTRTATPSDTPTMTSTPPASATPIATSTPSASATPTVSPTPSASATPTVSSTRTVAPSASSTPTASASPTEMTSSSETPTQSPTQASASPTPTATNRSSEVEVVDATLSAREEVRASGALPTGAHCLVIAPNSTYSVGEDFDGQTFSSVPVPGGAVNDELVWGSATAGEYDLLALEGDCGSQAARIVAGDDLQGSPGLAVVEPASVPAQPILPACLLLASVALLHRIRGPLSPRRADR